MVIFLPDNLYLFGILLLLWTAEKQKLFHPAIEANAIKKLRNRFLGACKVICFADRGSEPPSMKLPMFFLT